MTAGDLFEKLFVDYGSWLERLVRPKGFLDVVDTSDVWFKILDELSTREGFDFWSDLAERPEDTRRLLKRMLHNFARNRYRAERTQRKHVEAVGNERLDRRHNRHAQSAKEADHIDPSRRADARQKIPKVRKEHLGKWDQAQEQGSFDEVEQRIIREKRWGRKRGEAQADAEALGLAPGRAISDKRDSAVRKLKELFGRHFDKDAAEVLADWLREREGDPMVFTAALVTSFHESFGRLSAEQRSLLILSIETVDTPLQVFDVAERTQQTMESLSEAWTVLEEGLAGLWQLLEHDRERFHRAVAELARSEGLVTPLTDDEQQAFEARHGPIGKKTVAEAKSFLARIRRAEGMASDDPLDDFLREDEGEPPSAKGAESLDVQGPREPDVYALKAPEGDEHKELVYESLKRGVARFGFSTVATADLRALKERIEKDGWDSLREDEQECYQAFLLDIRPGDYVVYINLPVWGQCTVARIADVDDDAVYFWEWQAEVGDFNHRLRIDAASVRDFDRNAAFVHPALCARLKLPGRYWRIHARDEFEALLRSLATGEPETVADVESRVRRLAAELQQPMAEITRAIHHTHPNYDLEKLVEHVLHGSPGIVDVERRGGAHDHGADLLVTSEHTHPLTGQVRQTVTVIQVKSFQGEHDELQAIDDIRRAFRAYPNASEGLIISTAEIPSTDFVRELGRAREDECKDIQLLIGKDVASFVLRHGWDTFGGDLTG